jgi:hypothetical protein
MRMKKMKVVMVDVVNKLLKLPNLLKNLLKKLIGFVKKFGVKIKCL